MRNQTGEAKVGTVVTLAATSGGGTYLSFFTDTLIIVQWFGALVAVLSGIAALTLGVIKIHEHFKKRSR